MIRMTARSVAVSFGLHSFIDRRVTVNLCFFAERIEGEYERTYIYRKTEINVINFDLHIIFSGRMVLLIISRITLLCA